MKKFALIALSLVCIGHISLFAQEVEWSAKAGLNFSTLGKVDANFQPKIGYHAGVAAEFITTPYFSVQPELVYSLQGATIDQTQGVYQNYHYLNVPLVFKIYFYEDASFDIGAQYGYLLKAAYKDDLGSINRTDDVNRHDFALVFGFSYKLNEKFLFNLRYNMGLSNTGDVIIAFEQRVTNKTLQLTAAYIF
ncbi:MAG: porin family protein [Cyclobacteriaceae bacterium]|nr:porin family protein [Cyclobacteriaceae bacterium]